MIFLTLVISLLVLSALASVCQDQHLRSLAESNAITVLHDVSMSTKYK